jgi:hypothetical protein
MTTSKIRTTATPLPIPAFAPVLRPELDGAAPGLAVCDALAVGEKEPPATGVDNDTDTALVLAGIEDDALVLGLRVAANLKRLDVILQQLFSPQHQLPFAHFCTGAFSACHCLLRQFRFPVY